MSRAPDKAAAHHRASDNPHFATVDSWAAAAAMLEFRPLQPRDTAGRNRKSLSIHIRDHKKRDLAVGDRSLEAHYGAFVVTQTRKGTEEAKRWALRQSYGPAPTPAKVFGHDARAYELGPEVSADDIDGRAPAVVVWHDGDMFYLVASGELAVDVLLNIAQSMYA